MPTAGGAAARPDIGSRSRRQLCRWWQADGGGSDTSVQLPGRLGSSSSAPYGGSETSGGNSTLLTRRRLPNGALLDAPAAAHVDVRSPAPGLGESARPRSSWNGDGSAAQKRPAGELNAGLEHDGPPAVIVT